MADPVGLEPLKPQRCIYCISFEMPKPYPYLLNHRTYLGCRDLILNMLTHSVFCMLSLAIVRRESLISDYFL